MQRSFDQITDGTKGAEGVLRWAAETYKEDLVYACSFGAESMVLIDLLHRFSVPAEIVFLDTHLHFNETYELIDRVQSRYPELRMTMQQPELTLSEQEEAYGPELWKRNPDQCCYLRKIRPLERALHGVPAWISGLRRAQSESRKHTEFVQEDAKFDSVKICPLIHWTWEDVWNYIDEHRLDYNPLHDRSYPSIGCVPCTVPSDGGDNRDGRWAGTGKTECGLHLPTKKED
ncbi:phosphoadenylyl-sulfate reductase [Bacillus daqingensis]|uniref:Adenosine 5'-phosphosulfate reductase n=1 Tax=Bacillus daqingensis TaxID=872396 RepID=A0ABV9NT74_9BACI